MSRPAPASRGVRAGARDFVHVRDDRVERQNVEVRLRPTCLRSLQCSEPCFELTRRIIQLDQQEAGFPKRGESEYDAHATETVG